MEENDSLPKSLGVVELDLKVLSVTYPRRLVPGCKPKADNTELGVEASWRLSDRASSSGSWNGRFPMTKYARK